VLGRRTSALGPWLLAACLAGCAPTLVHRARSADRAHDVTVTSADGVEVLALDGIERARGRRVAVERLRWRAGEPIVPVQTAEGWHLLGVEDAPRWLEIGEVAASATHVAYEAADRAGWHVVLDGRIGPAVPALARGTLVLGDEVAAAVGLDGGRELVATDRALGPPVEDVRALEVVAKGRVLAHVAREAGREALVLDGEVALEAEEILEHAVADEAGAWAAIVGEGELVALVRGGTGREPEVREPEVLLRAPLLTHLRLASDGAHVACLVPVPDGGGIALARDGAILSQHRRAEGASLAFVPGTERLALVVEEAQGPEVLDGDWRSERFEAISELVVAPETVGFVGSRGGRSEVWVGRARVGSERWAGSLVLRAAPAASAEAGAPHVEHAYVARDDAGARAVVTRRGRWPVPRLFVDTLQLDETGHHWAALAPSPDEGRLEVWIDGEPRVGIDVEEVGSELAIRGPLTDLAELANELVEAELARYLGTPR
jgi:hypothetical protein